MTQLLDKTDLSANILEKARVPEHSIPLMCAMSGARPFQRGSYLFFADSDWIMAIGYPLEGKYDPEAFSGAVQQAISATGAMTCYAIAPRIPSSWQTPPLESDRFYILSTRAPIPGALRNPIAKARQILTIREDGIFTAGHRRLWAEFIGANGGRMSARVRELYARAPRAITESPSLKLLDAIDPQGNIIASLLLDYAPARFTSYIIGAHSSDHYVPHASDLLFAEMIARARAAGKRYIHLGLGVNDGITRFKRKWGGRPFLAYQMAQWERGAQKKPAPDNENIGHSLALALLRQPGMSARQYLANEPVRKPFAMIWEVEKGGKVSWLCGTAHFFCHSFEPSFRHLFRRVDNVIFEGPLDADFMARVDRAGKTREPGATPLIDLMKQEEIARLERTVLGAQGRIARALGLEKGPKVDVRWLLSAARPWCAFFTLWTAFLERLGWHESVDMEAWRIAENMNKNVIGMETLEEQLESLGSLPVERVLRFFRACGTWKRRAATNMRAYLAGDLEKMMGSSAEFPTRTEHVVGRRDQRFRERMRPWLEAGNAAIFVGSAHLVNLRHMLIEDGFHLRQRPYGLWPRMQLSWRSLTRPDKGVKW